MNNLVILYTMDGCPFCTMMKEQLDELGIGYHERDINEYKEEYDLFVEVTENEFVPSFMIIENYKSKTPTPHVFAPERDYNEIVEGVEIIKKFVL